MSPKTSSVEVGRASRKVMHEGPVRTMTEGAGGRTPPVPGGMACGHGPSGQDHKDERHVVREGVNEEPCRSHNHGRESVTKGTVQTRTDFSGEPIFRRNFGGSRECQFFHSKFFVILI